MESFVDREAVVSIDLGWSKKNLKRTAEAWCRAGGSVCWTQPGEPFEILSFLELFRGTRTLVLLDIPVHGTSLLSPSRPFRPLDRALASLGMPILPSCKAGNYGASLAEVILERFTGFKVVESYPYAVLRFLWAARREPSCLSGPLKPVVDVSGFMRDWPPKYKRSTVRIEWVRHMSSVLAVTVEFLDAGIPHELLPEVSMGAGRLNAMCDTYDALLGLVVGLQAAPGSTWFFPASLGDDGAMIPLLLDTNLREKWDSIMLSFPSG